MADANGMLGNFRSAVDFAAVEVGRLRAAWAAAWLREYRVSRWRIVTWLSRSAQSGTYLLTSSSSDSWPRFASSRMLRAVNCFEIDAAPSMLAAVIRTPDSMRAIPCPRSYNTVPLRLTAKPHPGESGLLHCANSAPNHLNHRDKIPSG